MRDVSESVRLAVEEWYLTNTHLEDWGVGLTSLRHEYQIWTETKLIQATSIIRAYNRFYIPVIKYGQIMFYRIWISHVRDMGDRITISNARCIKNSLINDTETITVLQRT